MNIVDIMLTFNSGLANEAIYYDKKVGILDMLDIPPRNGIELNKYLDIPLIKELSSIEELYDIKVCIMKHKLYYQTDELSKIEIQNNIKKILNN